MAFHPRKAKMQIAALQVAIDHIGDIGPLEPVARCIAILPEHLQLFNVILHTAIITAILRISGLVNAGINIWGLNLAWSLISA
jgi:hypothetical protein